MDAPEATPPPRRRLVVKTLIGLYVFAGVVALLLFAVGAGYSRSFFYLVAAAPLLLVTCVAWEVVERRGGRGGIAPWLAFPVAWLAGLSLLPALALAVYPPLEVDFRREGRVVARIVAEEDGRRLEIRFPEPVEAADDSNLRLAGLPLPREYFEAHREYFEWRDRWTLSIDLEPLTADLEIGRIDTVVINSDLTSRPFHYRDGRRVPSQRVVVTER